MPPPCLPALPPCFRFSSPMSHPLLPHASTCLAMPRHALPCLNMPRHALSCCILPQPASSCHILSYPALPHDAFSSSLCLTMPLTIPHRASPISPQVWHVHVWQIPLYPCNPAGHSAGSHLPEVASCISHRAVRATPALHNSVKSHELSGRHHNVELKLCTASSYLWPIVPMHHATYGTTRK